MPTNHKAGCPAPEYFADTEKHLFDNAQFSVFIGDIVTVSKDGNETKHGWGLRLANNRKGHDKAYCFKYCPWCGAEVSDGN